MVTLFAYLARRKDLTRKEFNDHWLESHGPLIASLPNMARHIVEYKQFPRLNDEQLSGSPECDGVTVQTFSSMDDFIGFCSEPEYGTHIAPDEKKFLDMENLRYVICDEPTTVISGSDVSE